MKGNKMENVSKNVAQFFSSDLVAMMKEEGWTNDSQWTDGIHKRMAEIGHEHGFLVFASPSRCPAADGEAEWLYDHHWRIAGDGGSLRRIPLAMEIEWGRNAAINEDFLKLVQARADLRVMAFQGKDVVSFTDKLVAMAKSFEGAQQGDRWLFAGWDWGTHEMHCRPWIA